jgi:hypothetical protein
MHARYDVVAATGQTGLQPSGFDVTVHTTDGQLKSKHTPLTARLQALDSSFKLTHDKKDRPEAIGYIQAEFERLVRTIDINWTGVRQWPA